jgi:ketosteroid isomerase-like protein
MRSRQRIVTGLLFLIVSAGAALGRRSGKETDAILAADAAWMKVYSAKDLEKSVAFFDNEGSMLPSNAPIATGKDALTKLIGAAFAIPDYTLSWQPTKSGLPAPANLAIQAARTTSA